MADNGIGDYFISDVDDEILDEDDELLAAPVVVPAQPAVKPVPQAVPTVPAAPAAAPPAAPAPAQTAQAVVSSRPQTQVRPATPEERLAASLDALMAESQDVQAAALVSMDGFTRA